MATPTIPNGEEYFFPIIYEGNGAGQRVGKFVPFTDNGTIDNSVIFNDGDSPRLTRTPSSAGDRRTATLSLWFKRGDTGADSTIFSVFPDSNNLFTLLVRNNTSVTGGGTANFCIQVQARLGSSTTRFFRTNRSFKDTSKFYHILLKIDTTDATESNRVRLYVDGDEITSFSDNTLTSGGNLTQNTDLAINDTDIHSIGAFENGGSYSSHADGYLAEVNWVDGTALGPETFGVTDTSTGRWIPKTLSGITYGTNGFRLKFQDSSALGDDTSGNGNDLTATNLASTDQTTDSPTQNFATGLGAFQTSYAMTMSEGNLKSAATGGSGQHGKSSTTLTFDANDSDGYYAEYTLNAGAGVGQNFNAVAITVDREAYSVPDSSNGKVSGQVRYMEDGRFRTTNLAGTLTDIASWGSTWGDVSTPDIIGIFVKNNKIYFSKNGTWQNSADPDNETGGMDVEGTIGSNRVRFSHIGFQSGATSGTMTANFGQKSFTYTPPTGYKKLNQDNLPETAKGITGMSWTKDRDSGSYNHELYDSSRGPFQEIRPNATTDENTRPQALSKFLKGGFAVGDRTGMNSAGNSYVSWNWVANSGTTSTNTDGSISSTVQANTTAGFSIVQYTGNGANASATIGHGLSSAPDWILLKFLNVTSAWSVYHKSLGNTKRLTLDTTDASSTSSGYWNNTSPTSSVFTVGSSFNQSNVYNYIAYCWHEVEGFSKFGKYVGNGSTDGPFIYTGFKPAMVMVKSSSNSATNWEIRDNLRSSSSGNNPITQVLYPNLQSAEVTTDNCDFLSNGFKWRSSGGNRNESGYTYIYIAFAEHPFVGDGTSPVTAR